MATTRKATTHWEGNLLEGKGSVALESSGVGTFDVSWPSRAEAANGKTSPEELIAAAHSSCYSMALSHGLAQAGTPPTGRHLGRGDVPARHRHPRHPADRHRGLPGLDAEGFKAAAENAKAYCPVSKALTATEITLTANLQA